MGHHVAGAVEQVGVGLLVENIGAQELLHGIFPIRAANDANHLVLEVKRRVENDGEVVVEQRILDRADARLAFHAPREVFAIARVGLLALVIDGEAIAERNRRVIELRVVRQLLDTGSANLVHARKRALVHGGQELDLSLRVGHPLADAPRRLLGGALKVLRVLLVDAFVVHRDKRNERGDDYGQRDKNHGNAAVPRFVVCFSHSLCSFVK